MGPSLLFVALLRLIILFGQTLALLRLIILLFSSPASQWMTMMMRPHPPETAVLPVRPFIRFS